MNVEIAEHSSRIYISLLNTIHKVLYNMFNVNAASFV
jgi:hypothetical protein